MVLALVMLSACAVFAQVPEAGGEYRQVGKFSSRNIVWIVAQVKLMFAAFILGVPMFALIIELIGFLTKEERYDRLAREFIKLSLIGFSATAALGGLLLFLIITFYPRFWNYMAGVFKPTMWIYPILFFCESFTLYLYWYGWDWLKSGGRKVVHLFLGLLLNLWGTALVFMTNAWATFMMTPNGLDPETGVVISVWEAINNATWHPLNIHRLIANAVFGGAIAGAYAAYKFLVAEKDEDRAYYDWMGYVGNMVAVSVFLVLPFAGYWLGKEIYDHNQQMGITLMGGFLSWLWIIQAIMIGILFLSANFYLWTGMERIDGAERYSKYIKYMLFVLLVCVLVWSTPHSLVASLEEARRMGGTHHPLLGVLGVMSAKNTAVNIMILTTFLSFMLYRRGNKEATVSWQTAGLTIQWVILGLASAWVIYLGVRGYFVDAATRIGFAPQQVLAVLLAIIAYTAIDFPLFKNAKPMGSIHWGKIPERSQYALFLLALTFCWLMGLMGYARSALRQHWHVYGVYRDTSADAFLPTLGQASLRISLSVIIFVVMISFIFWLGGLGSIKEGFSGISRRGIAVFAKMGAFCMVVIGGFVYFANSIPQVEHQPPVEIGADQDVWSLDQATVSAMGEKLFFGKGTCGLCHGVGTAGPRAPDLKDVAKIAGERVEGVSANKYLVDALVDPGVFLVEGYGNIMPRVDKPPINLTPQELYLVLGYLQGLGGGEITITKDDIPGSDQAAEPSDEAPSGVVMLGNAEQGRDLFFGAGTCYACHQVDGEGQAVGPDLSEIARINTAAYIYESILDPNKVVVGGYPPIMPVGFGEALGGKDLNDLMAYLMTLDGSGR
ncbi:cytochrome ubiquinol oxidase subunit I [Sulfidibacter corallicola]|uniref:Cytochrome ubiquinol oxidase subunit I n=1 Tax=Sulfidibacter corallicola TaxID=2818388 RepID=A0A8A4TH10_SULCO|nr:cytochrome ubiquinol oxidase subunit I [Sulfidibacter corallicola]QTD48494.1 cytochrome ubiquinol oxidase subunit I [Sulfidibacter corallicola]